MPMLSISKKGDNFSVSNQFVDKYMCDANGSFVKVYLYCLRYAHSEGNLSIAKIASLLNMIQSDVISALKYWDSVGVLKLEKSDKNDYSIELFDSFEHKQSQPTYQESVAAANGGADKKTMPNQPSYSKSDLTTAMQGNEKIKQLFNLAGQLLNKTLNTNDMHYIYMFYDYLKFPPEVIFILLEYCVSIGKSNMRYIEKVALSWADNEINTQSKAQAFIRMRNKENELIQKYKTMFKIVGRDFTDSEVALIKTWVNEYKLSDEQILSAYEITVMNTGKIALKYMDTVIKNKMSQANQTTGAKAPQKKNAFQDYNSDGYEYEMEMIKKNLSAQN